MRRTRSRNNADMKYLSVAYTEQENSPTFVSAVVRVFWGMWGTCVVIVRRGNLPALADARLLKLNTSNRNQNIIVTWKTFQHLYSTQVSQNPKRKTNWFTTVPYKSARLSSQPRVQELRDNMFNTRVVGACCHLRGAEL